MREACSVLRGPSGSLIADTDAVAVELQQLLSSSRNLLWEVQQPLGLYNKALQSPKTKDSRKNEMEGVKKVPRKP